MNKSSNTKVNPDLVKERQNATIDLDSMKKFLGHMIYFTPENYDSMLKYREIMVKKIKPIYEENFYNLDRDQKYQVALKKSLELLDFAYENKIEHLMSLHCMGAVMGPEKFAFSLHITMFKDAIEVWGTPEQSEHWRNFMKNNTIFGTYVQTEIGHGTYLKGLETTATYDKKTKEFIIDSPTLTSIKFWPGGSGKSCNFAIVMAKLIIDNKDYGIHAFVVQLRSLDNHRILPGLEIGDIGRKFGFDTTDNGYIKFNKFRIPRFNMLMQFAQVTLDGKFERKGSEVLMYAAMLLMRGTLPLYGSFLLSISTTIAIRYSCVRHQTPDAVGVEQQIINYQTQQARLFPALAATYVFSFAGLAFRKILFSVQKSTNNFKNVDSTILAKLHSLSSGLKSLIFGDCLKFAQSNRLCCGGHGYSASSGLSQIIQEADAGCTYEGDNIVLLLQTARYLLKCTQKGTSPHLELENINEIKSSNLYKYFEKYINIFFKLYDESMNEITSKLFKLVNEQALQELEAWNKCSFQLIALSRVFIDIFVIHSNISVILTNKIEANQKVLSELLELYIIYGITDIYASNLLRLNIVDIKTINQLKEKFLDLLPIVRTNAVALVDSFDMLDSNLCSSLGVYDGNVYERLLEFAQKSQFNDKDVHDVYHKYLKPFIQKQNHKAKL